MIAVIAAGADLVRHGFREGQPPDIALACRAKVRLNKGGCKCPKATG